MEPVTRVTPTSVPRNDRVRAGPSVGARSRPRMGPAGVRSRAHRRGDDSVSRAAMMGRFEFHLCHRPIALLLMPRF